MIRWFILLLGVLGMTGCASLPIPGSIWPGYNQKQQLAQAVELIEQGKSAEATDALAKISSTTTTPGVTDEALFRLSLLYLKPGATVKARHTLERLRSEYPGSTWSRQSAPLYEYLTRTRNLEKENRELRLSIDRLKLLDLELEQKR